MGHVEERLCHSCDLSEPQESASNSGGLQRLFLWRGLGRKERAIDKHGCLNSLKGEVKTDKWKWVTPWERRFGISPITSTKLFQHHSLIFCWRILCACVCRASDYHIIYLPPGDMSLLDTALGIAAAEIIAITLVPGRWCHCSGTRPGLHLILFSR